MKHKQRGIFFVLIVPILLLAAAGYAFFVWKWSFSEGERAGFVQKLSKKGFVCKTWEGDLAMVALPGAVAEKFAFTVWDDAVANDLNKYVGKRVALHYEEKLGLPTSCFGETRHIVKRVKLLEDPAPLIPAAPAVVAAPAVPAAPAAAVPAVSAVPAAPAPAPAPASASAAPAMPAVPAAPAVPTVPAVPAK